MSYIFIKAPAFFAKNHESIKKDPGVLVLNLYILSRILCRSCCVLLYTFIKLYCTLMLHFMATCHRKFFHFKTLKTSSVCFNGFVPHVSRACPHLIRVRHVLIYDHVLQSFRVFCNTNHPVSVAFIMPVLLLFFPSCKSHTDRCTGIL